LIRRRREAEALAKARVDAGQKAKAKAEAIRQAEEERRQQNALLQQQEQIRSSAQLKWRVQQIGTSPQSTALVPTAVPGVVNSGAGPTPPRPSSLQRALSVSEDKTMQEATPPERYERPDTNRRFLKARKTTEGQQFEPLLHQHDPWEYGAEDIDPVPSSHESWVDVVKGGDDDDGEESE